MEAGVPFALFSGVQIVALAAAFGLASLGFATRRTPARLLLVAGGLLLVVAHALTGATLDGTSSWSLPPLLRAAGYLLTAVGLGAVPVTAPLVVAPLGAPVAPSMVAAVTALVAATAATVRGRDRALLGSGFAAAAVAEALAGPARTSSMAATALLVVRLVSSLLIGGYVARRAQRSVLAKVVGAIMIGVVLLAVGAASAIGQLASDNLADDQRRAVSQVADGQRISLESEADAALRLANTVAQCLPPEPGEERYPADTRAALAGQRSRRCSRLVTGAVATAEYISGTVARNGGRLSSTLTLVGSDGRGSPLDATSAAWIRTGDPVAEVFSSGNAVGTLDAVLGAKPRVVLLALAPIGLRGTRPADIRGVFVYGVVVGDDRLREIDRESGFAATLLIDGAAVASSLVGDASEQLPVVTEIYREEAESQVAANDDVTVRSDGSRPTVHFEPVTNGRGDVIAVLALSAESSVVLEGQRRLLSSLFVVTLLAGLVVAVLAYALARRIVQPIRDLTVAAAKVRRGDLAASAGVTSSDEVGVLSRTFDTMTASLASSNEELRQSAAEQAALAGRLEAVLASMGDALVIADGAGRVTGVNPAGVELLGTDEPELLGRRLVDVLAGHELSGAPLVAAKVATTAAHTGVLLRGERTGVPVTVVQSPLRDGDGTVVVLRDTTRERQIERMKTQFLSNVSHELRTPLTPIRGYAEILSRRSDLAPEMTTRFAGTILESSLRMARVVDLLVDVAAIEAGRVEPDRKPVPVSSLVDERLTRWRDEAPERAFRRRLAKGLPTVLVDAHWVGKALDELLDNAVKYSAPGTAITITAEPHGDGARVTVRDHGEGIPAEQMALLFADFEQIDGSATRSVGGLGLGLSFVRRVSEVMGFEVHVESTPGKGSAFSLDLPAAAKAPRRRTK